MCFLYLVEKFKADGRCFLFALVNPSATEPIKITPTPGAGILCSTSENSTFFGGGPSFGINGFYDLRMFSYHHGYMTGSDFVGRGFKLINGCSKNTRESSFFTGQHEFEISEMEVFQVSFSGMPG